MNACHACSLRVLGLQEYGFIQQHQIKAATFCSLPEREAPCFTFTTAVGIIPMMQRREEAM